MKNYILLLVLCLSGQLFAQRQMEYLDRGVVAVPTASGVFVSWRVLGNEPRDVTFRLYRNQSELLTKEPLTGASNFFDTGGKATDKYHVETLINGKVSSVSPEVTPWAKPYLSLKMQRPAPSGVEERGRVASYTPNDCTVGDLDGDGEYEIIVKWTSHPRDNAHAGKTDATIIDAYKLDGTLLWRINLGLNIREGAHYTQMMVYDLDGDGIAEFACKTAPGTIDGQGKFVLLGNDDPKAEYSNEAGYISDGPEYLTVFNGKTGAEMHTIPYNPPRGNPAQFQEVWGDTRGNRMDRYLACIAYLDGVHPSLVMCRGYYTRAVLAAYDLKDGKLQERWVYDTLNEPNRRNSAYGQGNHSLAVGDVDGDGYDEIIYGAAAIDHDGKLLYTTGLGHGDAHHLSDLDPDRPGLELFTVHEQYPNAAGVELRVAGTGERLFGRPTNFDIGRGLSADIDPKHRGFEFWSSASDTVYNVKGEAISTRKPSVNFRVYWDGDLQDELLNGTRIDKWNGNGIDRIIDFRDYGAASINGTKSNPCLSADLFGDWREEVVYYNRENSDELMIFTTTTPTEHRLFTLMHDPVYRLSVAWQNVAYNQPPHLGFYIGDGLQDVKWPNIKVVESAESAKKGKAGQGAAVNDFNTPLHLLQPDYRYTYGVPTPENVKTVLDRILLYLQKETPMQVINKESGKEIAQLSQVDEHAVLQRGSFRLASYEWGVTYAGMSLVGKETADKRFSDYTTDRLHFLAATAPYFEELVKSEGIKEPQLEQLINPKALDDAGSMCAAFIKDSFQEGAPDYSAVINNYIQWIMNKQFRLKDGTLARNRPHQNTLWLDDMFMGIPALAWMGKYTGEKKYYDEAVKQIRLFSAKMFVKDKSLFMHGWVQSMEEHPTFYWGRANGWAMMTMVEVLEVLPQNHSGYKEVKNLLKKHISAVAVLQSGDGLWHQLLDRPDSYLETSASAIFVYCMARAINRGWIDTKAFAPRVLTAWNAIAEQVNERGQVEGTCVGTGMAFDPSFYYYRPVNVFAAHGYGPVLLAGGEVTALLKNTYAKMNDSAVQMYYAPVPTKSPIFEEPMENNPGK